MINEERVKEIVKILIPKYKNPVISTIKIKDEKVFRAQTVTESCVVCYVYENTDVIEQLSMDHQPSFIYELVFPEYYLELSDAEILKDVKERNEDYITGTKQLRQKRFLARDKKLDINLSLEVTEEDYNNLIDVIQKSNLDDTIKSIFTKDKWDNAYENLVDSYKANHIDSLFMEDD